MSKFKIVVNIIITLALVFLIYISRGQITEAIGQFNDLNWWFIALQIPVQILSFGAVSYLYYSYFQSTATLGKLQFKEMYKVSVELNFINSVFPSGGVSGFSYLGLRLRPLGITFASSTLAQGVRYGLTFLSFLIILGFGLLLLAIDGRANDLVILMGGGIFFFTIVGTAIFIYLIDSKKRVNEFVAWLPKGINKLAQILHYKEEKELISIVKVERNLGEIHTNYRKIHKNWKALKKPFLYSFAVNLFELLTIYLVYLALGEPVNPGAVILAYAVANFVGQIAILPGGIGIYEGSMFSVLKVAGIAEATAFSATLIYRVINLATVVPIGFLLYHFAVYKNKIHFRGKPVKKPKKSKLIKSKSRVDAKKKQKNQSVEKKDKD